MFSSIATKEVDKIVKNNRFGAIENPPKAHNKQISVHS